jgi:hypothetical protein
MTKMSFKSKHFLNKNLKDLTFEQYALFISDNKKKEQ